VTDDLPFIDEHAVEVTAPPDAAWDALWHVLRRAFGGSARSRRIGRALGVRHTDPLVGFRVAEEEPRRRLVLEGEHRFARYRLAFSLDGERLSAATHATFPGLHGRVYRALVISTGFHRRVVTRLLAATARRAAARGTPRGA
jgi:hypothetical protein